MKLKEEGKIQAHNKNDVYLISPYLPDIKKRERDTKRRKEHVSDPIL